LQKKDNLIEQRTCNSCVKLFTDECGYSNDFKRGTLNKTDPACFYYLEDKKKANYSKYFNDKNKFIPKILADELLENKRFITLEDNREIYYYKEGYYQPNGEVLIRKQCKNKLGEAYRKNRVSEVIDYIKSSTYKKRKDESPYLLPVNNGILDLKSQPFKLKKHSSNHVFFNKLPVKYNLNADCPEIKRFHKQITGNPEDIQILEEILGFCIYRDYFISKSLMLVGGGSNGKSTWLSLVKSFLGNENVSGRGLQDLEENRFAKADLYNKLVNIYADLPDKVLHRTGTFKMLTGRDIITAEKKFQHSFKYINFAKLLFSANKVPEAFDDTEAFFRRWIIIIFPRKRVIRIAKPSIKRIKTTPKKRVFQPYKNNRGNKRRLYKEIFPNSCIRNGLSRDRFRCIHSQERII
jgi:putative DNA primase/helicase